MKKNWNERTTADKILIIMRIVISVVVMLAAMVQILGVWNKAINVAVPLVGILMLVQSIQEWKTSRASAILGLCTAIFIFVCSCVVFFMK